jgi:hypothetical protein
MYVLRFTSSSSSLLKPAKSSLIAPSRDNCDLFAMRSVGSKPLKVEAIVRLIDQKHYWLKSTIARESSGSLVASV